MVQQLWFCWSWWGLVRFGSRPRVKSALVPPRPAGSQASPFHGVDRSKRGKAQPCTFKTSACITAVNIPLDKSSHMAKPKVKGLFHNITHNVNTQRTLTQQPDECATQRGNPQKKIEIADEMFNFSTNQINAYTKRGLLSTHQIGQD